MAELIAAGILAAPEPHIGSAYCLTGPEALTVAEAANIISEQAGQTITHVDFDRSAWITSAIANSIPVEYEPVPRVPAPSPDDVVSGLTFGFWPRLLDLKVDIHRQPVVWGPILVDVLPGHRQRQASYWAKLKHRDALFARLDMCNGLRNRIAHHEPIWKLGALMVESCSRPGSPVAIQAPAPTTPADALNRLRLLYDRVTELLGWLSPAVAAKHKVSDMHLRCLSLLQIDTLHEYRRALPPAEIDLARIQNLRSLRKALRYAARRSQPVLIKDGRRLVGHLYCSTP